MNDNITQAIQDIYATLPQDIRDALDSAEVGQHLSQIASEHRLHIDQAAELSDLASMVMLGLIHPDNFFDRLQSDLHLSAHDALAVANDVNEQILRPIKTSLMKIHEKNQAETEMTGALNSQSLETHPSPSQILHEIENPVAVPSMMQTKTAPTMTRTVPETLKTTESTLTKPQPLTEGTGINLIAQKLTQTIQAPQAEIVKVNLPTNVVTAKTTGAAATITPATKPPLSETIATPKPSIDPYRELI